MSNPIFLPAVSQRLPSLPHLALQQNTQGAYETPGTGETAALTGKRKQDSPCGLPDEIWHLILKNCWQDSAQNLHSASMVCKALYNLADGVKEIKNWQIHEFLFSTEAEALLQGNSLKGLQNIFQIIHFAIEDKQIKEFLFSKEAIALFKKEILEALQSVFQAMHAATQKGDARLAMLHRETLQKILRGEFTRIVKGPILKHENFPLAQFTQSFLLKKIKRESVNFFAAINILSRPLSKYKDRYLGRHTINLALGDLVAMKLCTQEELRDEAAVAALVGCYRGDALAEQLKLYDEAVSAKQVTGELVLFFLTHISSIFTQEQKPDMKRFIGLIPEWVWAGVVKTYKSYPLGAAKDLLASRIEAIVGTETAHWAISNGKADLLIAFLESDSNPNEAGKKALRCALELGRPKMVNVILHWAISKNKGDFLKILLALVSDRQVLENVLVHAKKMRRASPGAVRIVLERLENLDVVANYPGQQISTLHFANSA